MEIVSQSFAEGGPIPDACALAKPAAEAHVAFSGNRSPHLAWSAAPTGTKSFVLICVDLDAPTIAENVNKEGRSLPSDMPRGEFFHWVVVDIPASVKHLEEGACGAEVIPHGKDAPPGPRGARQGMNDYTGWFASDPEMQGTYLGYDGPGPPWNDECIHRYSFKLYAMDLEHCPVVGAFTANEVLSVIDGHVLDEAELIGTYTLNPELRGAGRG